MINLKIISKIATFFTVVSAIFVVLSVFDTYSLIQIINSTAMPPTDYVVFSILSTVMPYLFVTVMSLVVAAVCWSVGKESQEIEAPPQTQPAEAVA